MERPWREGCQRVRRALVIFAVLVASILAGCALLARYLESSSNSVFNPPPNRVSANAAELQSKLLVADMHSDALLSQRDLMQAGRYGSVDLPRLKQSFVSLVTFTQPTHGPLCPQKDRCRPFPNLLGLWPVVSGWPVGTWFDPKQRALYYATRLERLVANSHRAFVSIKSSKDLQNLVQHGVPSKSIGVVLGIEGAEALDGDARNVSALASVGYRIFGLVHQVDNSAAGSSQGESKHGLTAFGRQVVIAIGQQRLILDLAHASSSTIDDAVTLSPEGTYFLSHTGVTAICDSPRNVDDTRLREIIKGHGLVGIGFWDDVLCLDKTASASDFADAIAKSMLHVVSVAHEVDPQHDYDYVGLGSDFDGWVNEGFDSSGLALITDALVRKGVSEQHIRQIMGENYFRFLLRNLPQH